MVATLACLSTLLSAHCHASGLSVERAPGLDDCPDAAALTARIRDIRGQDVELGTTAYDVRFTRVGKALNAEIRVGDTSVRVLKARTESCDVLGQGIAVTLAMLLDSETAPRKSDTAADKEAERRLAADPKTDSAAPPLAAEQRRRARPDVGGFLGVGGGALIGVLGAAAPVLLAEGGFRAGPLRFGLGGLWGPPERLSLGPGYVSESVLAVTLRLCVGVAGDRELGFGVCAGALGGELTGDAHGFTVDGRHRRRWLMLPLEVSLAKLSGRFGWELTGAALVAVAERDFAVAGAGVAYRSPALGGLLTLRGALHFGE